MQYSKSIVIYGTLNMFIAKKECIKILFLLLNIWL